MKITQIELFPIQTPRETGSTSMHTGVNVTEIGEMSDLGHLPVMPDVSQMQLDINATPKGAELGDTPTIDV